MISPAEEDEAPRRRRLWLWSEWSSPLVLPPLILAEHAYPREDGSHPAGATSWSGAGGRRWRARGRGGIVGCGRGDGGGELVDHHFARQGLR